MMKLEFKKGNYGIILLPLPRNFPATIIKAVFVGCGSYKNHFGRGFCVIHKNVGFPLKRSLSFFWVGPVILLIGGGVNRDFVLAFAEFQVHGKPTTQPVCFFIFVDYVGGGTCPFVGRSHKVLVVCDIFSAFIFQVQKTPDVVHCSIILGAVNYQLGFVVAGRQVFCGVQKIVI